MSSGPPSGQRDAIPARMAIPATTIPAYTTGLIERHPIRERAGSAAVRSSAAANAPAVLNRSAGVLARALFSADSTVAGTVSRTTDTRGTGSLSFRASKP